VYARISQDRIGAGLGVERQEEDCRELARRLDWDIVAVHVDNDLSAYSGKPRPGYRALLDDIATGRVNAVLAWHIDRLHRSPTELESYISACEPAAVPTHTVRAGLLDLSTATGRMTARITGAVARAESEQKGERVARQKQQAQADGKWLGGRRPFGFEPDGVTIRPAEATAIRNATRDILAGHSLRSVVRAWNDTGITTSTGTTWDPSKFRQMMLRPRNAGMTGNRRRETLGTATWPAIVEPETWQALVALLTDETRLTHRGTSLKLVGSFLYRCECGDVVRSGGQREDGKPRYLCSAGHLSRVAEPIDDLVFDAVAQVLVRDNMTLLAPVADVAPLRERLLVLRARAEEIASMFGDPDSGMTGTQFKVSNERVQRDIKDTEAEIGRLTASSTLSGIADSADPEAAFRAADIDRQRTIIGSLVEVTLLRSKPGRLRGGGYFDMRSVRIEAKARPAS
jgi:site-specific DNA recombinase